MVFGICSLIFRLGCYVFCFDLGTRFDRGLGSNFGIRQSGIPTNNCAKLRVMNRQVSRLFSIMN